MKKIPMQIQWNSWPSMPQRIGVWLCICSRTGRNVFPMPWVLTPVKNWKKNAVCFMCDHKSEEKLGSPMPIHVTVLDHWLQMNPAVSWKKCPETRMWIGVDAGGGTRNQGSLWGNSTAADRMREDLDKFTGKREAEKKYGPPPTKKNQTPSYIPSKPAQPKWWNIHLLADFVRVILPTYKWDKKWNTRNLGLVKWLRWKALHIILSPPWSLMNGEKKLCWIMRSWGSLSKEDRMQNKEWRD